MRLLVNESFSNSKCAITNGLIDADYIMCGHQDVKTSTACPGYRFETNWVKAHSKYGRRSVDGGVSEVTDGELNLSFMPLWLMVPS